MASLKGYVPIFFLQKAGPTILRQWVLGSANILFFFAFLIFMGFYLRRKEIFLYWYASALALTSISLFAFFIQSSVGSPIGWVGRISQYLGGIYFLVAIFAAIRSAQTQKTSFNKIITASLSPAEEKYRALVENFLIFIFRLDHEMRFIYVNPTGLPLFQELLNTSMIGKKPVETNLPVPYSRLLTEKIRQVLETGQPMEIETYMSTEKGLRFFHSHCVPEFGPQGKVNNILIVSSDFTKHRKVEESLQQNQLTLQSILNATQESIWLFSPDGSIVLGNQTALQRMGRPPEEVIGKSFNEILPSDLAQSRLARLRQTIESGQPLKFEDERSGLKFHHSFYPVFDREGRIQYVTSYSRDITEKKRAEEEIARLASFPLVNPNPVVEIGLDGHVDFINPSAERLFPDLKQQGSGHPWLADWPLLVNAGHEKDDHISDREIRVGECWYYRSMQYISSLRKIRIYGFEITERKKAEEALLESERRNAFLAGVLERASQPFAVGYPDGHLGLTNQAFEQLTGYSTEELRSMEWAAELTPPEWQEEERRKLEELHRTGRPVRYEKEYLRKDGSRVPIELLVHLERDEAGNPAYYYSFLTDITERKQAEEALRLFELVSLHTRDIIFMIERETGRILEANLSAVKTYGYSHDEFLTMTIQDLRALDTHQQTAQQMAKADLQGIMFETVHRRRDGSTFPVEVSSQGAAIWGRRTLISVIRDITERKREEELLLKSEARFKLLSDTAGLLLITDDPQGLVNILCQRVMMYLDCQAFFNFLAHEPTGRLHLNAYAGIPEEEAERIEWLDYGVAVCGCAARDGLPIVAEHIPSTPDVRTELVKSYGIKAYACHPFFRADGRVIGTISFGTRNRETFSEEDLSLMKAVTTQVATAMERKKLIEELRELSDTLDRQVQTRTMELNQTNEALSWEIVQRRQVEEALKIYTHKLEISNRELQQFAFVASHDLQEPLRKIQTFGRRLESKYHTLLGETGRDYLQRMNKAAKRMQDLIKALLDLSRVTTKTADFVLLDLRSLVMEVIGDLEVVIEKARARIDIGELSSLEVDPIQMRRLFQNLIGNALKFHGTEPPVIGIFGNSLSKNLYQIIVQDNGIGFEEEYADLIFAPFQRLHSREDYEGTGMGLPICRRIVEHHGGTIATRSTPGQGSIFTITLPLRHLKEIGTHEK